MVMTNFKKIMVLGTLFLGITNYSILAMETVNPESPMNDLSDYVIAYILEFLYQPNSIIPDSYISTGHDLVAFAQTSRRHRLLSLRYTENCINSLIKFDKSTGTSHLNYNHGVNFISACCAFKIISKIKEIGIDDFGKNFCEQQFRALMQLQIFHNSFREMCVYPIQSLISKIFQCDTTFFRATQKKSYTLDHRKELIAHAYLNREDIDSYDENGATSLHWAVAKKQLAIIKMLLAAGANVNAIIINHKDHPEFNGFTTLHLAVINTVEHNTVLDKNIVAALLIAGANIDDIIGNPRNQFDGFTALHIASSNRLYRIIRELVRAGADINKRVEGHNRFNEFTALHIAAFRNDLNAVILLLKLGANPTLLANYNDVECRADALTTNPDIQRIIQAACNALL